MTVFTWQNLPGELRFPAPVALMRQEGSFYNGLDHLFRLRRGKISLLAGKLRLSRSAVRNGENHVATEAKLLMVQFLCWFEARPRTLAEVRNAWISTCPLNCAWEDALTDDLVHLTADGAVILTAAGQARLAEQIAPAA